jgi:hypothetical protein
VSKSCQGGCFVEDGEEVVGVVGEASEEEPVGRVAQAGEESGSGGPAVDDTTPLAGRTWIDIDVPEGESSPWLTLMGTRVLEWWDATQGTAGTEGAESVR